MAPIRRFGQRFFGGFSVGVAQVAPQPWRDDVYASEGHHFEYRYRRTPEIPGRVLHDGTRVKGRKSEVYAVRTLVSDDAPSELPPTGRDWPRGLTGWKLAGMLILLFPIFGAFSAFRGLGAELALANLPFVDATDPKWAIPTDSATDAAASIQAMLDSQGAATYYFSNIIYMVSKPLLFSEGVWIVGAGSNTRQIVSGTTFKITTGGAAATWAGQGIWTTKNFANNVTTTRNLEQSGFDGFLMDANGQSYGNGIQCMGAAQPIFRDLRWENYLGNQGMPTRGAGVSKAFGQGFAISLTVYTLNGTAFGGTNPNDPMFVNCRQTPLATGPNNNTGTFSSSPLIWTDDDGTSSITDGIIIWCQPEGGGARAGTAINNQAAIAQGVVDIQHAGAWHIDFYHQNGPGGQGLVLRNCMATNIMNSWLDGWGSSAGNGNTWDCVQATTTTGGGAGIGGLNMWGNWFRYRDEQVNSGGTVTYRALNFTASGNNAMLNFFGNTGFIQSTVATGTMNIFNLALGAGTMNAVITSNAFWTAAATPFADANIFQSTVSAAGFTIRNANNNWDYVATLVPTTGQWPTGYTRWTSAPAVAAGERAICTAGGNPGTWATNTLMQEFYNVNAGQTNSAAGPTFATITGWSFAIGASEVWSFECHITGTGPAGGMKFQVTGPAIGAGSLRVTTFGETTAVTAVSSDTVTAFSSASGTYLTAITGIVHIWGCITNGVNAGTIAVQFEPAVSAQSAQILANSYIKARRIS